MKFNGSQITVQPSIENVIDSYKDVQHLAMEKIGLNFIYIEITAAISKIRLEIKEPTPLINVSNPQTPSGAGMHFVLNVHFHTTALFFASVQIYY